MANILIIGCGYIGTALAKRLHRQGHQVWGAKRDTTALPKEINAISIDLLSLTDAHLPRDIDYIIYMASPDAYTDDAYRQVYQLGLRNLLFALEKAQITPKRLILVSSTGVYPQTKGEWVDETTLCLPVDFAGQRVISGEMMLLDSIFESVIVRFGGIYGPGRDHLLQRVHKGQAKLSQHSPFTNRIYLDDAVNILRHILFLPNPEPIYIACDSAPTKRNEVITWLAEQLAVELSSGEELNNKRHLSNKRCSNKLLVDSGYQFIYPSFREGYFALLHSEFA